MGEKVVAEVTRLGRTFEVRLLYGKEEKTIRYASNKARKFASKLFNESVRYNTTSNVLIYDYVKKENVLKYRQTRGASIGFEGGKNMNAGEVLTFISLIGGCIKRLNVMAELIVRIPDIDYEEKFEIDEGWYSGVTKYFF